MKYLFLLTTFMVMNLTIAQIDSSKINKISLNIEVGMPTSIFLNNYSQNNNFTTGIFKPFTQFIPPYTIGFKIMNGSKYILGLNYIYFNKTNSHKGRNKGDVVNRFYHVAMAEVGKSMFYNRILFSPTISFNYKVSGVEEVLLGYIPGSWNEPITSTFRYNSLGVGFGGAIKFYLLRNVYISTDLRYTHFFENNKILGKPQGGYEEFYKNYRVNRDVLTLSLNIGYRINISK